ncbi:hypothetical protein [Chitinophaga sp. LS1]|uniref:hypothetical protein n=1 Tax=Chitinophaga sp. LS1 TaxID=3051176 RepID=UPI002AABBB05|nr:hypothetical protein [Chitinophaga sp. LS1]WPV66335.1 hypothetical protein QQL36_31550 [Chitinophaga sp. LS1]
MKQSSDTTMKEISEEFGKYPEIPESHMMQAIGIILNHFNTAKGSTIETAVQDFIKFYELAEGVEMKKIGE